MIKLTRLNNHLVAINPDHISWVDSTPDTTLVLISNEKIIIRETVDELIAKVLEFRRQVRWAEPASHPLGELQGDPPRISSTPGRASDRPPSFRPRGGS